MNTHHLLIDAELDPMVARRIDIDKLQEATALMARRYRKTSRRTRREENPAVELQFDHRA